MNTVIKQGFAISMFVSSQIIIARTVSSLNNKGKGKCIISTLAKALRLYSSTSSSTSSLKVKRRTLKIAGESE